MYGGVSIIKFCFLLFLGQNFFILGGLVIVDISFSVFVELVVKNCEIDDLQDMYEILFNELEVDFKDKEVENQDFRDEYVFQ